MATNYEAALQRALGVRLNLQIGLSSIPAVEEWMDIHLDRWLENVPMPPEMPSGEMVAYHASFATDLSRLRWQAVGHPAGFVPKMAQYFKLCAMGRNDEAVIDALGNALEPKIVGSWIGVWDHQVVTGWQFGGSRAWADYESHFGTHEAKFRLKNWYESHPQLAVDGFAQAIGDQNHSEVSCVLHGELDEDRRALVRAAYKHFVAEDLSATWEDALAPAWASEITLNVRIAAGNVTKVGLSFAGLERAAVDRACALVGVDVDPRFDRVIKQTAGSGPLTLSLVRAGHAMGVDVGCDPTVPGQAEAPAGPAHDGARGTAASN